MEKLKALESELSSLKPFKERHIVALGFLRKNLHLKEDFLEKEKILKSKLLNIKKEVDAVTKTLGISSTSLSQTFEGEKKLRKELLAESVSLEKNFASKSSTMKWKKQRFIEIKEEIKQKEEQAREMKSLVRFKGFLEKLRAVFHKDALQMQLRLKARPLIEDYTRDIFLRFNLPYSDVTLTDDFSLHVHGEGGEETLDMLSGGERIAAALALRVGLSRALSGQALELIILDEPTIHLDAQRRRELVEIIRRLATIPQTIVVTHDKEFEESADRIIEVEKIRSISVVK